MWRVPELWSPGEKTSNAVGESRACRTPGLLAHTLDRHRHRHVCMCVRMCVYACIACRVCLRPDVTTLSAEGPGSSEAHAQCLAPGQGSLRRSWLRAWKVREERGPSHVGRKELLKE